MSPSPVLAAGAVCWRVSKKGKPKILLVHRTQHKDVSLPKGKVDPGETLPETAVREIAEETGLIIALGAPLGVVEYQLPGGRDKQVYYWAGEVSDEARANSTFVSNDEIEQLRWVGLKKARKVLSYPHDVDIVDRFAELYAQGRARTFAIIALRHGKAVPGEDWDGPDATRPLMQRGINQSLSVSHGIAAYRPRSLVSSTAERCLRTIAPTARVTGLAVEEDHTISQDAYRSDGKAVRKAVAELLAKGDTVVLCSHGPVLPQIISAVMEETRTDGTSKLQRAAALATGEYAVLHVPIDHPESGIVAVEVHSPTA
ncbi:NUDIX hydrolase [Protaetiibacter sp. SSC-01]|uniref:NUDIX hydrolase n=1 Tax=Protaetiibacter sp. SSC-01 TaxID=2759943 RepID=UPI001656FCB2|nr:NUDIX domain-containing protein [Protaetiibacter sp. SSC-01]QNO37931.1 NUDIX hydrolase [Protaetiibacter sp. SSC-01]